MRVRSLFLTLLLLIPFHARAAEYVVRSGDTLEGIAARYHISVSTLAQLNHIQNVNLVQMGRTLFVPTAAAPAYYRVRWGDTLIGISARYGVSVASIRALNPRLGVYPLAGQLLKVCSTCGSSSVPVVASGSATTASSNNYRVQAGDSLSAIASRFGTTSVALLTANGLADPNRILIGANLVIPQALSPTYAPSPVRSLIVQYARIYGMDPALPLAVAWQESGFNQSLVSYTGAIGVMQVEPYTGRHIQDILGRQFNLWNLDDNVHAGVFWLSQLLAYYGGNVRLAVAAYYEGTRNIAIHGFYEDTVQYVNNVLALMSQFGG